jgi:hypothetical protein
MWEHIIRTMARQYDANVSVALSPWKHGPAVDGKARPIRRTTGVEISYIYRRTLPVA